MINFGNIKITMNFALLPKTISDYYIWLSWYYIAYDLEDNKICEYYNPNSIGHDYDIIDTKELAGKILINRKLKQPIIEAYPKFCKKFNFKSNCSKLWDLCLDKYKKGTK